MANIKYLLVYVIGLKGEGMDKKNTLKFKKGSPQCVFGFYALRGISAMNGDGREKRVLNQPPCDQEP